jgi:hypothetical protein
MKDVAVNVINAKHFEECQYALATVDLCDNDHHMIKWASAVVVKQY